MKCPVCKAELEIKNKMVVAAVKQAGGKEVEMGKKKGKKSSKKGK